MVYTKQTWADDDATKPLSAARMGYIEQGIYDASLTSASLPGAADLDSFSGATDDDKFGAALSYAAAQTYIPAIRFGARVTTLSTTRTPFSGMKLIGPAGGQGPKNLELSSGKLVNHRVQINSGNGTSSWFYGTGTYYDIFVGGLAFQGNGAGNTQFWHQPSGSLYACQFDSLTHYGFKHIFGMPASPCAITAVVFTGVWEAISGFDTQFTLGGSDSQLWMGGQINLQARATAAEGTYQMILSDLNKTNVGYVYITSSGGTRGLWIKGTDGKRLVRFFGGSYEGYNAGNPNHGCNIRVDNNIARFYAPWIAYGMSSPQAGEYGIIQVNGGKVLFDGLAYDRGNTALSVPLIYQTGGKVEVRTADMGSETPIVTSTGGTLIHDASVTVV